MRRPEDPRVAQAIFFLTITLLSTALWLVRWESSKSQYMGDSYAYAERAYEIAGHSPVDAGVRAMQDNCQWLHHRSDQARFHGACSPGYHPERAQYQAIFTDRVGFPLFVAALLPLLHHGAFGAATAVCAVLSAVGIAAIVCALGGSKLTAVAAVVLLFGVRDATWLARVGSEAPAMLGIVAVVGALVGVGRFGWRRAVPVGVVGALWLFAVRPSSAVALSAAVALVYAVCAARTRRREHWVPAAAGLVAVSVDLVAMRLTHSPGLVTTLQDTFTRHFARAPVHHLPQHYALLLRRTGSELMSGMIRHPVAPLVALIGAAAALAIPRFRLPASCVLVLVLASAAAHPIFTEVPRLLSPGTAVEAIGLAMGLPIVVRGLRVRWRGRGRGRGRAHHSSSPAPVDTA